MDDEHEDNSDVMLEIIRNSLNHHDQSYSHVSPVECTMCGWSGPKKKLKNKHCPNCGSGDVV